MTVIKVVKKVVAREAVGRSGITSPYFDLAASIAVAETIHKNGGGSSTGEQLAAWLGYKSMNSGTYLTRIGAANKHFALIESSGDTFTLTERAMKILSPVMPEDAVNAKIDAFLVVTLFAKVYEQFRGQSLPPEVGLKNLFQNTYKVLPDRVSQSVRVFLNSAEQAGFFATTGDRSRLVKPSGAAKPLVAGQSPKEEPAAPAERPKSGGGDGPTGGVHSAIIGVLRELPPPGPWKATNKKRFKDALMGVIDLIYPDAEESS